MSSFRTLLRRRLGLSVTLVAIGALLLFSGVALADQSEDLHCPDGWTVMDDDGMEDNDYVPEAGLLICVKAGSPYANEEGLGNTGLIYTDGETTLQEYLYEAGIVDGSGEVGRDVSYWVTYPELSAEIHVWKDAPDDPDEDFDFGGGAVLKDGEYETASIGSEYLVDGSEDVTIAEQLTDEQIAAGWTLDEVVCDTDAVEPTEGGVIVTVEPGDDITCTFYNVLEAEEPDRSARLTVFKDADGDESEEFLVGDMELTGGTGWYWDLDNEDFLINDPDVVIVVVTEELTAEQMATGWALVDVTCDDAAVYDVDLEEATLTVTLSDGDDVTCTFFNEKAAEVPTPTPTPTETGGVLPGNPTPTPAGGVLPDTALPLIGTSLLSIGMVLLLAGSLMTLFVARMRRAR